MKNKNPYGIHPNYILRVPFLSLDFYQALTSDTSISDEKFRALCDNKMIQEAIFLASPTFYDTLIKWRNEELKDIKKEDKFKSSLLKYVVRMSTRCTPFGIFAGCAVGELGKGNEIVLEKSLKHKKRTRFDMNYLINLAKILSEIPFIKEQLKYYPNSSLYKIGRQLRYVEYHYVNSKRHHDISSIDNSEFISLVLDASKKGILLKEIVHLLSPFDFTDEEIRDFTNNLISNQILISELEPSVAGIDCLQQIIDVLKNIENTGEILGVLSKIQEKIIALDSVIGTDSNEYVELIQFVKKINVAFDSKYQFQTDMQISSKKNILDKSMEHSVLKGLYLLNKLNSKPIKTNLTNFAEAFSKRYDDKVMDLSYVLDPEIGIGYMQSSFIGLGDNNPLIDDLILNKNKSPMTELKWSHINDFFNEKLHQSAINNDLVIKIRSEELNDFIPNWNDLSDTMSGIVEIVSLDNQEKVFINSFGHSSASNLISRFSYNDQKIFELIEDLTKIEDEINPNKILAEILHLPEDRAGNVIMRPSYRKHEIPYLSKSNLPLENQINIDDLEILVKDRERIILRSKKHKKEVKPYLSNAHNYTKNSLPIYHFLCDMQSQNLRSLGFNVFPIAYDFIPRIECDKIILQKATWNFKSPDIERLKDCLKNDAIISSFDEFRKNKKMPELLSLVDGDNELLINFKNIDCIKMLVDIVRVRTSFQMIEFLYLDKTQLVRNEGNEFFTNQIIFSILKKSEK